MRARSIALCRHVFFVRVFYCMRLCNGIYVPRLALGLTLECRFPLNIRRLILHRQNTMPQCPLCTQFIHARADENPNTVVRECICVRMGACRLQNVRCAYCTVKLFHV